MITIDSPAANELRRLLSLPRPEVISRKNAWAEITSMGFLVLNELQELSAQLAARKQSSSEMSTLASDILRTPEAKGKVTLDDFNAILSAAKSLAGSVLSQDETKGQGEPVPVPVDTPEARAERALIDAQVHGQAHPIVAVVHDASPMTQKDYEFIKACEKNAGERKLEGETLPQYLVRLKELYGREES